MNYNTNGMLDLTAAGAKWGAERQARARKYEHETADKTLEIFDYISAQLSARPGTHDPREIKYLAAKLTIATRLTQIQGIMNEGIDIHTN